MSYPSDDTIQVLRRIESLSISLQLRARWLDDEVAQMMMKPSWPTKAEEELDAAITKVNKAFNDLIRAKDRITKMKVEPNPF